MKKLLVLAIALLFLIPLTRTAFAAPAPEVKSEVTTKMTRFPFKGTVQSTETSVTVFPTMSVTGSGSGNATQLGPFTINYQVEINLLDLSGVESAEFTGTKGDSIRAEAVGLAW